MKEKVIYTSGAASEEHPFSFTEIPYPFLLAIARVIREGEKKYGLLNWKKGSHDPEYRRERRNHLINHLLIWNHQQTFGTDDLPLGEEDHLAKAAWGIMCELYFRSKES